MSKKVVIFSAPSGSGKSTVVSHVLPLHPEMEFSVSATSRKPRGTEQDGVEYLFYSADIFRKLVEMDKFVEYEEVYKDNFYGTLKSEVNRIWSKGHVIIFDVDVKGGVNLKKYFGDRALSVFIQAPSVEALRQRLINRGTDSLEAIEARVAKAAEEMTYAGKFDYILVNDDLETALKEAEQVVDKFFQSLAHRSPRRSGRSGPVRKVRLDLPGGITQESVEGFGSGGNGPRPAAGCDTGGIASSATACVGG